MAVKNKFIFFLFLSSLILFLVPYLFSENEAFQGVSYMVGFNNRLALVIFCLLSLFPLYRGFKFNDIECCWEENPKLRLDKYVIITLLIVFIIIVALCVVLNSESFWGFVEGGYFMHYFYALKYDVSLFSEIQFIYGPLTIYPVYWLYQLGIPEHYSYYLILSISHIIGLLFTFYILCCFSLNEKERKWIFIIITVITFPYTHGINNSLLRYAIAPFFITNFVYNCQRRHLLHNSLFSFLYPLTSIFYSPEVGLCYLMVICIWLIIDGLIFKRISNFVYLLIHLVTILCILFFIPDYLSSIIQAGSGGSNFPFVPSLLLILLFTGVFIVAFYFGNQIKCFRKNLNYLAVELCLITLILPAIGRCDPYHIISNCLFLFVLSYCVGRKFVSIKVITSFYLVCLLSFFPYQGMVLKLFVIQAYRSNKSLIASFLNRHDIKKSGKESTVQLLGNRIKGTVTSISVNNAIYSYLHDNYEYKETYFGHTPQWIGKKNGFDREVNDLIKIDVDYIVLPLHYDKVWLNTNDYSIINLLYCTYYPIKPYRFYNKVLYGDLIDYLKSNYREVSSNESCTILKKIR